MISWQLVILICTFSILGTFILIYLKEFKREQQAINNFLKIREEQLKMEQDLAKQQVVYLMPTAAKKKSVIATEPKPAPAKDKKNIN